MTTRNRLSIMFFIKRKKLLKNGEASIFVRIRFEKKFQEIAVLRSTKPELWNTERGYVTGNKKDVKEINSYLDDIRVKLQEHYFRLRSEGREISVESIKKSFLGIEEKEKTILSIFREHNDNVKLLVGKDFAPATHQRYETSMMHLADYISMKYKKEDLLLSEIDYQFITGLELYLKVDRNCGHNTTVKYIKNFKKIIRIAQANGWIKSDPFIRIKMPLKKVDKEFLTEEELNTIIEKDFGIERLNNVKDIFLFGCFTGLAYSDLKLLKPENVITGLDGGRWIITKRLKTDNDSHIPLLPIAAKIVDKYKDNLYCNSRNVLLPVYSNQKLNCYLKEIGDVCGIRKHMSTHMARHTFATTVTLNNDIPIESVSKMLGHSSIKMTQVYAKLLDKKVAQDMARLNLKYSILI